MDLRCSDKKHGELTQPSNDVGLVEFKCPRGMCGAGPNTVVLHTFRTDTGELVKTQRFKQPRMKKGEQNATEHDPASLRSA